MRDTWLGIGLGEWTLLRQRQQGWYYWLNMDLTFRTAYESAQNNLRANQFINKVMKWPTDNKE